MADIETTVVMEQTHEFVDQGDIADSATVEDEVSDDILQQALEEASDDFQDKQVIYTDENGVILDPSTVNADDLGLVTSEDQGIISINSGDYVPKHTMTYTIGDTNQNDCVVSSLQSIPTLSTPVTLAEETITVQNSAIGIVSSNDGSPLGSSNNPIRIVQQGNQYVSMQQLTPQQIQQIMQVLQQQQVAKATQSTDNPTVLFHPNTNTKVVYRVIQPSELHRNSSGDVTPSRSRHKIPKTKHISREVQAMEVNTEPKRRGRRKKIEDEEEEWMNAPELSREEKEERKKHRPRTRSGRVSKPPKHMVKDYKHIHVVDWDEDYDDSDGGYSDFKESDEEGIDDDRDTNFSHPGLGSSRHKAFKCQTCEKSYIGQGGLARHYRLFPDHGHLDETIASNLLNATDKNTEAANSSSMESASTSTASSVHVTVTANTTPTNIHPRGRGRGRPPGSSFHHDIPARRKMKLRDIVRQCEDEELMEIVLPRLVKAITCWEFMMMRTERGKPMRPDVKEVYKEFESVYANVKKMCRNSLLFASSEFCAEVAANQLQVTNDEVAQALGLQPGTYNFTLPPTIEEDVPRTYKFITADNSRGVKRSVEIVSPESLIDSNTAKKSCLEVSENIPVTLDMPTSVTLSEPLTDNVQSLDLVSVNANKQDSSNSLIIRDGQIQNLTLLPLQNQTQDTSLATSNESGAEQIVDITYDQNHATAIQTSDGIVVIRNPDGTVSLQGLGDQEIPLETVQALLAMDTEGQTQIQLHTIEEQL